MNHITSLFCLSVKRVCQLYIPFSKISGEKEIIYEYSKCLPLLYILPSIHPSIHSPQHFQHSVVSFGPSAVLGTKDVHLSAALREVPVQRDMVV